MKTYDVIVIGSGTAGQNAAFELASHGFNVALVEQSDTPGGVCALRGCQAKKWFYEVTELAARSRHLLGKGITAVPRVSWGEILRQKNDFTSSIPKGTVTNLRGHGIDYLEGEASFADETTLRVASDTLQAKYYIIASGALPADLPLEGKEYLATSNDFLDLTTLPPRIGFIGGGFVSFELAHFAVNLGSIPENVHILENGPRPLSAFDADMVDQLVKSSASDGIRLQTETEVRAIKRTDTSYRICCESGKELEVDLVVNGAGRPPKLEGLGLDKAKVSYSDEGIEVDASMRTSQSHIFAIGDCAATVKLARVADMEGQVAAGTIIACESGEQVPTMNYAVVPSVLFTYPQLGMVGKTEDALKQEGVRYWKSSDTEVSWPTYRRLGLRYGAYKILVDKDDRILGAHFLFDNTTGLVNTFKQAMLDGMTIADLHRSNIMAPYPSRESDILYMLGSLLE